MSKEVSHYVVTAHPPGSVLFSTSCNFLAPDARNVVLAKPHSLEVREYTQRAANEDPAFQMALQAPINGRITSLLSFHTPHSPTAFLFFTTDALQYAVVTYDAACRPYSLRTHASGSLMVHNARAAETGPIVALESRGTCIAMHVVDGFVHVLPIRTSYRFQRCHDPSHFKSSGAYDDDDDDDPYDGKPRAAMSSSSSSSSTSVLGEPFHCRLEEARVLAMTFVPPDPLLSTSASLPLLAVLHQDARGGQHLISHAINVPQRTMHLYGGSSASAAQGPGPATAATRGWVKKSNVDGGSAILIPVPPPPPPPRRVAAAAAAGSSAASSSGSGGGGAVLILGQRQFTYVSAATTKVIPVAQALYLTFDALPPDPQTSSPRYLIGDEFGNLHMLTLLTFHTAAAAVGAGADNMAPGDPTTAATAVVRLQMDTLGSCAIASTASYLDHGVVFVGSVLGDSQLVQISDEPIEEDAETLESTYLSVVEEFTNLGPILDLDVMDHGPGLATRQVVTASGSSQSGSLRLIRNGIGMNESAVVEIPGIQAMWSVKGPNGVDDAFLVQSFVTETRVLGVVGEGLEEVELPGLDATCSTLYVGNVGRSSLVVQVTATEVRLIDAEQGTIWDSHAADITVAAGNCCQVAIALRGGRVVLFTVDASEHKLVQQGEKQMDREVSCLDVHPFSAKSTDGSAMDVDDEDDGSGRSSDYLAVGLWDDCTIRMLATSTMQELLCVNLEEDDPDDTAVAPSPRRTRNNMMARSLCMLTLDYSASGSAATGTSGSDGRSAAAPGVEMLFVGLGDGTLVSFAVLSLPGGKLSVRSKKEVCLGTQRIDLVPLHSERGGTCVLATGDRPTVIYLAGVGGSASSHANPKLCYSNVNLSSSEDDAGEENSRLPPHQTIAVNVATPFMSPVLFDTLGSQHYSLCVADDTHLRLGVIDDIQKLHVTTCRLGMAPRRIAHCASGRLFAVGCVESGINHVGLSENEGNMTNCIRFMDETTFDDIERVDLEPFEMLLSLAYVTLKVPLSGKGASDGLRPKESVSPIYKPFLLVGTAFAIPDEDEPTRGRILVYSFQGDDTVGAPSRVVRLVTETACTGGVYSLCQFYDGMILCSVNTKTMLCRLVDETGINRLEYAGTGHHGHILSLCVKSLAKRRETHGGANPSGSVLDDQQKEEAEETPEMLAIVGDLMRSVSLVQFYPEHEALEEIARDFNPNWTTACEMLNDNVYLAAENFHNLFCLRRNHAMSEEFRCRLDTTGEYHLGEQVNKFMSGSLVMPVTSSPTTAEDKHSRRRLNSPQKSASPRTRRAVVEIGSQVLFGTVEGTLGVSLGLDGRTAAFFSSLERAMASVIKPVGNLTHEMYRAVKGQNRTLPAHGFVDGDLVESFLDLDRALMELVVKEMNREGRWEVDEAVISEAKRGSTKRSEEQDEDQTRSELTVDDVLAMVEEMTMLH